MSKLKSNEKVIFCKKCVESNQKFVSSIPHKDKKNLYKTIDKFRPDHLWKKKNDKWELKNAVWKDEEK